MQARRAACSTGSHALAGRHDRRIMVRLVKGAYWDSEIKHAQVLGVPSYPVFTRKLRDRRLLPRLRRASCCA